jgi:hypothetical protein
MNMQETFTAIATHLLTQMKRSSDRPDDLGEGCLYRSPDGLKCALGAIIKDEFCDPALEDWSLSREQVKTAVQKSLDVPNYEVFTIDYKKMLQACQNVHDNYWPSRWREELTLIANQFKLEMPA